MAFVHRCRQHPISNMAVGVCTLLDGLVRLLSFGTLGTDITLRFIGWSLNHQSKRK